MQGHRLLLNRRMDILIVWYKTMQKKKQKDDDEPQFSRRIVKGEGGKYIIEKAWEFAKSG